MLDDAEIASLHLTTRRLMHSDRPLMEQLQDRVFRRPQAGYAHKDSYPNHDEWFERAILDVRRGRRLCYGLFGPMKINDPDHSDHEDNESALLGFIFLKRSITNVIELKHLLVYPQTTESCVATSSIAREAAGRLLISRAVHASQKRGFQRLELELPTRCQEQIGWFLADGFTIAATRETGATQGARAYLLVRDVSPLFSGDPFSTTSIAKWLLAERFGWQLEPAHETLTLGKDRTKAATRYWFHIPTTYTMSQSQYVEGAPPPAPAQQDLIQVFGDCIVDRGHGSDEDFANLLTALFGAKGGPRPGRAAPDISLFLSRRDLPLSFATCAKHGARVIAGESLETLLYGANRSHVFAQDPRNIGGVLLEIGSGYQESLTNFVMRRTSFDFVLTSGLGAALPRGKELDTSEELAEMLDPHSDSGVWAVFMQWREKAAPEVIGYAPILEHRQRDPAAKTFVSELGEVLGPSGFEKTYIINDFIVNFHERGQVWILSLGPPSLLANPVPLDRLSQLPRRDEIRAAGTEFPQSCYLDTETVTQVLAMKTKPVEPAQRQFLFAITSDAERSDHAAKRLCSSALALLKHVRDNPWFRNIAARVGGESPEILREISQEIETHGITIPPIIDLEMFPGAEKQQQERLERQMAAFTSRFEGFYAMPNEPELYPLGRRNQEAVRLCKDAASVLEACRQAGLLLANDDETITRPVIKHFRALAGYQRQYAIALSFSSSFREEFVEPLAERCAQEYTRKRVLYDKWIEQQQAIWTADSGRTLPALYFNDAELVVVCCSKDYRTKQWTGLEFDEIKSFVAEGQAADERVLPVLLEDVDLADFGFPRNPPAIWLKAYKDDGSYVSTEEIFSSIKQRLDLVRRQQERQS